MNIILLTLRQALRKSLLVLGLMLLLSLSNVFVFASAPVYATTSEELKLIPPEDKPTQEEKIDRAYNLYSPATGFLEEIKQQSETAKENFPANERANVKSVTTKKEGDKSSPEKMPKFIER